ncbi:MAG: class I SAM-dependent methyltransferase [Ignavibacteriaceae bacterium]|nr:class I SAM-dependent methyltransferase [Ignavibacteriaceae bacterium]
MNNNILNDAIAWDVVNWSKAVALWERNLPENLGGLNTLELGCGANGGLTLWLSDKGASVVCSGYAGVPDEAKVIHRKYGFSEGIRYETIDALAIPYEKEFDIICFKSMLGGIERDAGPGSASKVIAQIHKALKPGGILLFAENLESTSLHKLLRGKFGAGKNKWHYFACEELPDQLKIFKSVKYETFGFLGCLGLNEPMRNIFGKMDTLFIEKLTPADKRYIISCIAVK